MVGMQRKTFYNTVNPFWVDYYKKKTKKKEKPNDRTRQKRQA